MVALRHFLKELLLLTSYQNKAQAQPCVGVHRNVGNKFGSNIGNHTKFQRCVFPQTGETYSITSFNENCKKLNFERFGTIMMF